MDIKALTYGERLWEREADYAVNCSWSAGSHLSKQMRENGLTNWERVFVVLVDSGIAGYCALTKEDCIPNLSYSPFIGFIFVDEAHRGKRISEALCLHAIGYAKSVGFDKIYLISDHVNLYEKYGFIPIDQQLAPWGTLQTIFMRQI